MIKKYKEVSKQLKDELRRNRSRHVLVNGRVELLETCTRLYNKTWVGTKPNEVFEVLSTLFESQMQDLVIRSGMSVGQVLDELQDLFEKKNNDYGDSFVAMGIPGIMVRLYDKLKRMETLVEKNEKLSVVGEKIEDTLMDGINYCILALMMHNKGYSLTDRVLHKGLEWFAIVCPLKWVLKGVEYVKKIR